MKNRIEVLLAALPQYQHIKGRIPDWFEQVMRIDPDRAEFHATRLSGFGGSEIGALAANADGVRDDFSSARDIVKSKLLLSYPEPSTGHLERGVDLEPIAKAKFQRKFRHLNCRTDTEAMVALSRAVGRRGWERYSPDDILLMEVKGKTRRILADYKAPAEDCAGDDEEVKARYAAQLHLGRYLCEEAGIKIDGMVLAPLSYSKWDTVDVAVTYDRAMEARILEAGDYYWNNFVLKGELPPYVARPKFTIENEDKMSEAMRLAANMTSYKLLSDFAGKQQEEAQKRLKALLGEHRIGKASLTLGLLSIGSSPKFDAVAAVTALGPEGAQAAAIRGGRDVDALVAKLRELGVNPDDEAFSLVAGYDEAKLRELLAAHDIDAATFESDALRMGLVRSGDTIKELKTDAERMIGDGFEALSKHIAAKGLTADVKPVEEGSSTAKPRQRAA